MNMNKENAIPVTKMKKIQAVSCRSTNILVSSLVYCNLRAKWLYTAFRIPARLMVCNL